MHERNRRQRVTHMIRMTKTDAQALAVLTNRLRPDWQIPGIITAIQNCDAPPLDTCIATLQATANHEWRTPALIPQPGPHWRNTDTAANAPAITRCPHNQVAHRCHECSEGAVTMPTWFREHVKASINQASLAADDNGESM